MRAHKKLSAHDWRIMTELQQQGFVPVNQNVGDQSGQQPVQPVAPAPQPEPTNDRTSQQFEKLLESNRQLYENNRKLQEEMARRQAPQTPVQPRPTSQPQQVDPREFVETDPVTGEQYINGQKMAARVRELEQQLERTVTQTQSFIKTAEQRDIERQTSEAYAAHPELEPGNTKFSEGFHRQVRGVLTDSMFNAADYGGRPLTFREAADLVKKQYQPVQTQTPVQGGNPPEQESAVNSGNALKEQGSAQVMSQPQNAPMASSSEELEALRFRTRQGDDQALAARLIATEHTRK